MADIVIRGMEMPPEGEYHMTLYVCNDGYAYFDVDTFQVDEDRFEAVPLPKGHGRLGDLDRLFEVMGQDADRWIVDEVSMIETDDVLDAIQNAPTIVPSEGGGEDG